VRFNYWRHSERGNHDDCPCRLCPVNSIALSADMPARRRRHYQGLIYILASRRKTALAAGLVMRQSCISSFWYMSNHKNPNSP
jgi:hypothetical protein